MSDSENRTSAVQVLLKTQCAFFALILVGLLAACSTPPSAPAATATPATTPEPTTEITALTAVTHNSDWAPVVQAFGGIDMVLVPAGCFTMGHDEGRRDERPEHQICFELPYWIDRTEVTNAQYGSAGNQAGDNYPRENLLWSEARDFCAARGGRLPSEAEWEYAARGPDSLIYPWGNELVDANLVFDRNSPSQTAEVGSKPAGASWVGALDMSGNVYEWVSSIYARYPYDASDGREATDDTTSPRVYRGGIQSYIDFGASATIRFRLASTERNWFVGFRCARSYEG